MSKCNSHSRDRGRATEAAEVETEAETEAESHYIIPGIAHSNRRYTFNITQILFRESLNSSGKVYIYKHIQNVFWELHNPLAKYTYISVI